MIQKQNFKVLLYLKKSSIDKQGKAPVMGRITLNDSATQFSCKISCRPQLWNPRLARLVGKSHEAIETNAMIEQLLLNIHTAYECLTKRNIDFNAQSIREMAFGRNMRQTTLLTMMDRLCEDMEKRVGIDRSEASLIHYRQSRKKLAKFIETRFHAKDLTFSQLNDQFISDYYVFLTTECGFASNSTRKYLTFLRKACRMAYKDGLSERLLFANYTLPKMQTGTPRSILPDNFRKIKELEIPTEERSLRFARDLLFFSCFTGTAYVDAVSVTKDNLVMDEKGCLWLKYYRHKTKTLAQVKLLPEAIALIKEYKDKERATLMPYMRYKRLWDNLRKISRMAGSTQMITPHMGRHYYASIVTLAEDVPIDVISKMLGHTNIGQTQVYARVTQKKLFDEAAKFVEATKDLIFML